MGDWDNLSEYERTHAERYRLSLEFLRPHLRATNDVIDLGGGGSFLDRVRPLVTGKVGALDSDLRRRFTPPDAICDVVLCMEVLEHIHDQEAEPFATEWRATGTANLLAESFRILRPGGFMFLTTPNACSLNAIIKAMHMQPPMIYRPHVREYAPVEVVGMMERAGFRIEKFDTCNPWGGGASARELSVLTAFLNASGRNSPHRGECMMVLARKPISHE